MVTCDHRGALHRCSDLVGRPCSISAIRFHAPSFTPLPTAALYLKRSRQGGAASSAQLDRRVAYDGSGRILVGEIAAKQKRNHWSSWEWCQGATTALVKKELLKPRVMSAALKGALGTAHDGARREPIRLPDDPAGQVAAAGQPPTPPPSFCTEWLPAAADEPVPGTAPTPGTAPVATVTTESVVTGAKKGTRKQRRRAREAARKQRREAKAAKASQVDLTEAANTKGADDVRLASDKKAGGGGGGRAIARRGGGGGGGGGGVDGEDDDAPAAEGAWSSTTHMTSRRRIEGEASTIVHERQSQAEVQIGELLHRCEAQLVRRAEASACTCSPRRPMPFPTGARRSS
jgi:hypothetical protein